MARTKKERDARRAECLGYLRERVKPGQRITFVLDYFSPRGYSTHGYRALVVGFHDGEHYISDITYLLGVATGYWVDRCEGIRIGGCGYSKVQSITEMANHLLGGEFATKEGALRYER
jgi:hypothetical protein